MLRLVTSVSFAAFILSTFPHFFHHHLSSSSFNISLGFKTEALSPFHADLKNSTEDKQYSCRSAKNTSISLLEPDETLPNPVREYILWHRQQRVCLEDPVCYTTQKIPLLLSHCASPYCLGLGDRMRGVYFSFLFALVTRRVFLLK